MVEPERTTLTVFAAASLTEALSDVGDAFAAANPDVRLSFNFAGSQQLAQQIAQGAPGDVFASANEAQVASVVASGQIEPGGAQVFAGNQLVVVMPLDNPAGIERLEDLARPGVKLVLAAPEVPAGVYARSFLERAAARYGPEYPGAVMANAVSYEPSVRAVFTKVALGEADAGIVYTTDVAGNPEQPVGQLAIPDDLNITAYYLVAPLANSHHPALADAFVAFLLSPEAQAILAAYGFAPAGSGE
jgi:molybdate transport system substrate-binding protein